MSARAEPGNHEHGPADKTKTVLYHGPEGKAAGSSLLADGLGPHHGWIRDGGLRILPPTDGSGEPLAW